MELIHVDLSAAELISAPGPLVVPHGATGLDTSLVEGQEVLVTDRDGEFHAAVVLSAGLSGDNAQPEPVYALHIGARLPMDMAAQRLTDVDLMPENRGLHEIVDLLGDLRRAQVRTQRT
jgi:hypothetical protein